jgi:CHAT domain-containing protein/tetratricopeptide (TPR) repeat protein
VDQPRNASVAACPDAETIACYIEGNSETREREFLQMHFADCERCQELLVEVAETLDALGGDPDNAVQPAPRSGRRWIWSGLAAAAIVLLAVGFYDRSSPLSSELRGLVEAAGQTRVTPGRFTGFAYAPLSSPTRATTAISELSPDLRIAAAHAEKNATVTRTAATLHALGVAKAFEHDFNEAVGALEEAASLEPSNQAVLANLAATYLARATASDRADDLPRGLDAAERAVRAARDRGEQPLSEAMFNRALLLQRLGLRDPARQAWSEYLELDGTSLWAKEAREHLQKLGTSKHGLEWERLSGSLAALTSKEQLAPLLLEHHAQNLREHAESTLRKWAIAALSTPGLTTNVSAGVIADALADSTGDQLLLKAISALSNPQTRASHVRALVVFDEARRASERFEFHRAEPLYRRADRLLSHAGNPMALWARFWRAQAIYYARRLTDAEARLSELDAAAADARYLSLRARVRWLRGLVRVDQGRFVEGENDYRVALAAFERLREWDNRANVLGLIADHARLMADYRASWTYRLTVLEQIGAAPESTRTASVLLSSARLAESQGLVSAAMVFQNAAVAAVGSAAPAAAQAQVLLRRASTAQRLGRATLAFQDAEKVRSLLALVTDKGIADRLEAERLSLVADLSPPAQAKRDLTYALTLSEHAGLSNHVPSLSLKRARVRRSLGDFDGARADLLEGIRVFERQRRFAGRGALRVSYFDSAWVLFTELVDLSRAGGDLDSAFQFSERGRGRWLHDQLLANQENEVDRARIRRLLPEESRVLYYAVLPQHVIVWVFWRDGEHVVVSEIGRPSLSVLSAEFVSALAGSRPVPRLALLSSALFDALIAPVQSVVPPDVPLIFIPDPQLGSVPFAALRDAKTGKYLLETNPIGYVPSARILRHFLERKPTESRSDHGLVTVIAPGALQRAKLPSVRQEIRAIVASMPQATVWEGSNATRDRFFAALSSDEIVHFSGHAVANPEFPDLSHLVFDSEPDRSKHLHAADLHRAGLRAQLVVLAACSTAGGAVSSGEGVLGLYRPMLASGIPTVVATFWKVEDDVAAHVFGMFYRGLAEGRDSVRALQHAQVAALQTLDPDRRDPRRWSAFAAMGAPYAIRGAAIPVSTRRY